MTGTATLAETVAGALRDAIMRGDYLSGDRLLEINIARTLSVSQNTVRDALRLLERDGWVVKYPRRGVYVRQFTREEAAEVCALLLGVTSIAVTGVIARRAKPARLRQTLETARKHLLTGSVRGAIDALFAFHLALAAAGGGQLTVEILERLHNRIRLLEHLREAQTPSTLTQIAAQIDLHEALLHHIENGTREPALAVLREQVGIYEAALLAVL